MHRKATHMPRHPSLHSWEGTDDAMPHTSIVLLTGVDRLAIDAVAFSLMDSLPSATSITYDVFPDDSPASGLSMNRTVHGPADSGNLLGGTPVSFDMEDCCLTCACKHDLARELNGALARPGAILATLPIGVEATAVAQHLADCSMLGDLACTIDDIHVATAVGLDGFESRLFDDDRLVIAGVSEDDAVLDSRSTGVVQSRLIREAGHVLILPLMAADGPEISSRRQACETDRLAAIVAALADPAAIIHPDAHRTDLSAIIRDVSAPSHVQV